MHTTTTTILMAQLPGPPNFETPTKAKVQGAVEYLHAKGRFGENEEVFKHFKVGHTRGYAMLNDNPRRHHNNPEVQENRGRKPIIGAKELKTLEGMIKEHGFGVRAMTWEQLAFECDITDSDGHPPSGRTVQRAMGRMDYHKCIACKKGWVSPKIAKDREDWLLVMLER